MIFRWNSKVTFNNKTRKVDRIYEVSNSINKQLIAKVNAVDNSLYPIKDHAPCTSVLLLDNKKYYVKSTFGFEADWFIVDENQNVVFTLHPSEEKYIRKKKKLFSKEIVEVNDCMYVDELTMNGRNFVLYNVCLGTNKQYIVIHENGNVVSEIHIDDKVVNYAKCQDLYCINDKTIVDLTIMYCYLFNVYFNWKHDESIIHENGCGTVSFSKDRNEYLLSKFSQEFINRIIAENQME